MKTSTTAKINTRKLFQYITNEQIDDSSWWGTTSVFLTHWTEQIHMYDENIGATGKLSDEAKRWFLENTVQTHAEFRTVKSTEDMFTAIGSTHMTFQQYYDLLQSAAQRYNETMSKTKKPSGSVYMSEMTQDDEEHYADTEERYDIATPVDIIQTN